MSKPGSLHVSTQLPVNQWQLEIENLSNVGLATFQLIGVQAVSPPALQLDSNTTYDMYITAPNNNWVGRQFISLLDAFIVNYRACEIRVN
jgi:hypothetical protein